MQQNQFTCNLEDHLPRQKEHQEAAGKLIWSGTSTAVDAVLLLLTCLLVILGGHPDCECPQLHMCTRAYLILHHLLHRSCVPAGHGTGADVHSITQHLFWRPGLTLSRVMMHSGNNARNLLLSTS